MGSLLPFHLPRTPSSRSPDSTESSHTSSSYRDRNGGLFPGSSVPLSTCTRPWQAPASPPLRIGERYASGSDCGYSGVGQGSADRPPRVISGALFSLTSTSGRIDWATPRPMYFQSSSDVASKAPLASAETASEWRRQALSVLGPSVGRAGSSPPDSSPNTVAEGPGGCAALDIQARNKASSRAFEGQSSPRRPIIRYRNKSHFRDRVLPSSLGYLVSRGQSLGLPHYDVL